MGTFITGSLPLPPYKIDATPPQGNPAELDAGDINYLRDAVGDLRDHTTGWVNVKSYGAKGDGVTDDTAAIQAAINAGIAGARRIYFPSGTYSISAPLILRLFTTSYQFFSVEMEGEKRPYGSSFGGASIVPTFNNTFAIGIQSARMVTLRNIAVVGKNAITVTTADASMMTNANFVMGGARDSRYSPYAGVVIDPFGTSVPADGGYPGLSSYYHASATGSSAVTLDNVDVRQFVANVLITPNGNTQNAENITIRNSVIGYGKTGISICQSQSRNVNVSDSSVGNHLYGFDGNTYGAQQGVMPNVRGVNMNGKFLFNATKVWGQAGVVSGLYAESFASIGFLGTGAATSTEPFVFDACTFHFGLVAAGGLYPDWHMVTYAPVTFRSCQFGRVDNIPFRFFKHSTQGSIVFDSCTIDAPGQEPSLGMGGDSSSFGWDEVEFRECSLSSSSARGPGTHIFSSARRTYSWGQVNKTIAPFGSLLKLRDNTVPANLYVSAGESPLVLLASALAVTAGANGTGTFNPTDATMVNVGDTVYALGGSVLLEGPAGTIAMASQWVPIGTVTVNNGTTVTVGGMPQNWPYATTVNLYGSWLPRWHQGSTGDTTSGTNTILNVTSATTIWAVGNHIQGAGIAQGTYITAVSGTTITVSKNATATATGVRLFDANVYLVTGTAL